MGHFLVFAFLLTLLGGVWAALSALQQYRAQGVGLFRSLFQYLVSFDLLVFGCFAARYAHTNLIGEDPTTYGPAIWVGSALGVFVLEIGLTWTILRLSCDLRFESPSSILKRLFAISATLIGVSYVIGSTIVTQGGSHRWIVSTHQAVTLFMMIGIGYALLGLILGRHDGLGDEQRRSARRLGWLLLVGFLALPASLVLPGGYYLVGFAAGLFWLSCAPLLWLRRYTGPYLRNVPPDGASKVIGMLAEKYNLTRREQEIMALIMEGRSNKEIQDLICVSFSTVKNHVYNMYRKLEVKSRAQLMHLVMVERERQGLPEQQLPDA